MGKRNVSGSSSPASEPAGRRSDARWLGRDGQSAPLLQLRSGWKRTTKPLRLF
ncbi:hypothetical protein EDP1_3978 [Pseudomonas putida S610]|nr:hypothetical protein EDP1_3978 [Pseudomonas putida S610]